MDEKMIGMEEAVRNELIRQRCLWVRECSRKIDTLAYEVSTERECPEYAFPVMRSLLGDLDVFIKQLEEVM